MEAVEAVAWAVCVLLPACIMIAPVLLAVLERSLPESDTEQERIEREAPGDE